jgi:YD repeat-containing protein
MNDQAVRGRRVAITSRAEGGRIVPIEASVAEVVEPVMASAVPAGIGALVEALVGGLTDKWERMTAAMESAGSRPVVVEMPEHVTAALTAAATTSLPDIIVNVPPQPTPVVNVTVPDVIVNVPEQPSPIVNVAPAQITVEAQPAPVVNVTVEQPAEEKEPDRKVTFKRDGQGRIISAEVHDDPGQ